jgi:hypothetical protein
LVSVVSYIGSDRNIFQLEQIRLGVSRFEGI